MRLFDRRTTELSGRSSATFRSVQFSLIGHMPFTNDEIRTIIRDRPKLALVDDGGHPPFVVDGRHVIDELVEIIKERLPHVPTDDPQARLLTDLHDVLEAILLTPRRRV